MNRNSTLNVWDTYLLYQRYLKTPNFPETEKRKLINGLVRIIQDCNDLSTDASKVYHLTEQFRKENNKGSCE